jgi:hypothetical protein
MTQIEIAFFSTHPNFLKVSPDFPERFWVFLQILGGFAGESQRWNKFSLPSP